MHFFFIDFIELYRRTSNKIGFTDTENVIFTELLFMTFLKAPNVMQKILPLTVLIGSIVTFLKWSAEPELEIRKNLGIKVILFFIIFSIIVFIGKNRLWREVN